jgi:tetratricopeptide (TPR) repeat protein
MRLWACVVAAAGLIACGPEPQAKPPALEADPPLDEGKGQVQGPASGSATNALNRGTAYLKNEKYDEAIAELTKAIETNPKSIQAHFYMGLAKEKKGDRAGAEQAYKAALDIDPSLPEAAGNLAAIYLDEPPRPDLAIGVLEKVLKKSPDSPILLQNLAYAYNLKNDVDNAAKYYEAAIAKEDSTELRFALGVLLAQAKRYDNALPHLKKALAGMGDKPDELATLGGLFWFAKAWTECIGAFDRAIKIKGTDPEWFTRRGTCRQGLKDEAGAMADYQAAVKADPKFAPAHYYLAIGMLAKKEIANAESELKLAVQHGGDSPIGKSAKEKLAEMRKRKR